MIHPSSGQMRKYFTVNRKIFQLYFFFRPHSTEYEVVEGCEDESNTDTPVVRKKGKSKRRSDSPSCVSPTKMKKLKLVLGSETMSTVNYSE